MVHAGPEVTVDMIEFDVGRTPYVAGYRCEAQLVGEISRSVGHVRTAIVIADSNVEPIGRRMAELLRDSFGNVCVLNVAPSESTKTLSTVERLIERALHAGVDRDAVVIALGGGVVGNLAGMVAGLLFRGVPIVHLPTTPVAAYDAVLSRKQAVNSGGWKNPCGLYTTPALIAVDLHWLESVSHRQMSTGLAEMAKNVLAVCPESREHFSHAVSQLSHEPTASLRTLLRIGIETKAPYLRLDGDERGAALVFEYGHTIGHAIEAASHGEVSHGESVAWGMLAAADLSRDRGDLSDADYAAHDEILALLQINRDRPPRLDSRLVKTIVRMDNKRGHLPAGNGRLPMVLLSQLGRPMGKPDKPLVDVDLGSIDRAIDSLLGVD
jgi:3-dehydroquinate synthetase